MIRLLRIQNLAVVEEVELELGPGLNILTGPTGAGKSMVVQALELLRGGRASPHLLRTGADRGTVEALVERDGREEVLRRVIRANGRSRAYIDGGLVTVQTLRERTRPWLDISSQHEHHALTDPRTHLTWLDRFGRLEPKLERLRAAVERAKQAAMELERFRSTVEELREKADYYRYQLDIIEQIAPRPGELDEVLATLDRLSRSASERDALLRAVHHLSEGEHSATSALGRALVALRDGAWRQRVESALVDIEDLAGELAGTAASMEVDPAQLAALTERERALSKLVERYRSIDAALAHRDTLRAELDALESTPLREAELEAEERTALDEAARLARALSEQRHHHAAKLERAVSRELTSLGMGAARIDIQLAKNEPAPGELEVDGARLGPRGLDRATFLIAPNPGEAPRPLARVASGGELSRALLALKQTLAALGPTSTSVFDEVDTGVGGAIAEAIGRSLSRVARHHQVICITHQAVIAAWADTHFLVHKAVEGGRTRTRIELLDREGREREIARMLGGAELSPAILQAARDLLRGACR